LNIRLGDNSLNELSEEILDFRLIHSSSDFMAKGSILSISGKIRSCLTERFLPFGIFERVVETGFRALFDTVDDFIDFFLGLFHFHELKRKNSITVRLGISIKVSPFIGSTMGVVFSEVFHWPPTRKRKLRKCKERGKSTSILDFVRLSSRNGEWIYSSKLLKRREGIVDRRTRQSLERTPELA